MDGGIIVFQGQPFFHRRDAHEEARQLASAGDLPALARCHRFRCVRKSLLPDFSIFPIQDRKPTDLKGTMHRFLEQG
jgi:hypothetical protein